MDQTKCIPLQQPHPFYPPKGMGALNVYWFHMLNKPLKFIHIHFPKLILDCLYKARVFSKIDLSNAYHQVAVEPLHTYKSIF